MTTFALLVLGAPYSSPSEQSAWRFAEAALAGGHRIFRVFFFHDAVLCGSAAPVPATGEAGVAERWARLAQAHEIDLVVCVTSAVRRGVLDPGEAKRHQRSANLAERFGLSGLGQWVEACLVADRVVSFGA
jgi:tRNA 2-thiouridine synthesizing protein D